MAGDLPVALSSSDSSRDGRMVDVIGAGFWSNSAITATIVIGCMLVLWVVSIVIRDMSIVDIFWGPGFGVVALVSYFSSADVGVESRRTLLTVLTVAWSLRLGIHLFVRNHGKGEDPRYTAAFRARYSAGLHLHTLFKVFLLQGVLIWLISMPVQVGQFLIRPERLGVPAMIGALLWAVGFLFEAVADWQLARFKRDPANRGRVLDSGLWRYTRHPNYFGNACLWWGLFLIACDHWLGVVTIFAPLLMTHFLVNVTGKALLESRMRQARPEYADYIARTSGFFPRPPRS
jgi:steroid 5-alpha reductase family enzyme